MENFIEEILDYTLPKQRSEYGGYVFPRSFIADVLASVIENYKIRLLKNNLNPALYGAPAPDIVKYICGYHYAHTARMSKEQRIALTANEGYRNRLVRDVTDSLFILENVKTSAIRIVNEYNPVYCRFNMLLDYLLAIGIKNNRRDKPHTVMAVMKLFESAFLKLKGITTLFADGLEKEAIIVWRSLHELECVISVLCKYNDSVIKEFETFDRFSKDREDMDEQTKAEYDERIAKFGVNVKNNNEVDHFENYGWLGAIEGLELTKWNLNFRYLEDLAGLSEKYKEYQVACDASHMNAKILKWDKQRVLDFVVKRCFNSLLFILNNYSKFLEKCGFTPDHKAIGKMIGDLKGIIDIFLP
ncbi:MAG: hypothetical protein IJX05_02030 [Clostridia bacterium]|nr:hypothetical protein [Clostridia bacterium]